VNVWVYEGTLKLEHQAVTLSRVELHEDRRHIKDVSNSRVAYSASEVPSQARGVGATFARRIVEDATNVTLGVTIRCGCSVPL
jgi:hypothetical protein